MDLVDKYLGEGADITAAQVRMKNFDYDDAINSGNLKPGIKKFMTTLMNKKVVKNVTKAQAKKLAAELFAYMERNDHEDAIRDLHDELMFGLPFAD